MGLASSIETPNKPAPVAQPWTVKRLFPISGTIKEMTRHFSPFELFSTFMIFITGIGELVGREFTWYWYLIIFINLSAAFYTRYISKQYGGDSLDSGIRKS